MQKIECKLTVFFDEPFWIGVYERITDGQLEASKITFGPEPKDYEVYDYLLKNLNKLRLSPPVKTDNKPTALINPKRRQRAIKKQLVNKGTGTKAQQALKLQQAEGKEARKKKSRWLREQEKERQFLAKQEKKKQKHKGH
ncbi:hypothetical protein M2150_001986 [Lachnospiraceae bacterium PM6-15]|uniref:YjdF family protein n=1 Tax=Ohessyouella blattaphilus TaxID=2949333 RepID=UPI003E204844